MLTIAYITVTNQQPHYPEIHDSLWRAAFQGYGSDPDHYLDPDRSTVEQDDYGRTWEFRFTPVSLTGDSIQFQGCANPPGQRQEPTHQALITARFTNPQDQAAFVAALPQSVVHQPEDEPDYRTHDATEALRAMSTYDQLGENAMLLHLCAAREKQSAVPAFAASKVEVLDDSSTVALDLTQHPHRYRFTWHLMDQAKSATRPVQQPLRDSYRTSVPVSEWPSSDDVVAMIIEHAVSRKDSSNAVILDPDPALIAAADTLAPSLRPLVIDFITGSAQPSDANDILYATISDYAILLQPQVPEDELDRICRHVMDHNGRNES